MASRSVASIPKQLASLGAYAGIRGAGVAMGLAPLDGTISTMRGLARVFANAPFNRKRLSRAVENLGHAFPEWDEAERRAHAVYAYEHLFTLAVETALAPRLLTPDGWSAHVVLGDLADAIGPLVSRPGGVGGNSPAIMITGHTGNWEVLGYTMALLGFPMHALYRPMDLAPLDRWVRQTRQRRGLVLLDKNGATERMPELISRGAAIGFVADQNAGDRGLFVPFFGRLASSYKSIGLLAIQYRLPIVCGQARRLVPGRDTDWQRGVAGPVQWNGEPFRLRIDAVDTILPSDWESQPDPLFYVTARYRRAIEVMVRRAPEQYLWMHRYWKSRPRHEKLGRAFPAALREKMRALPWMTDEDVEAVVEQSGRDAAAIAEGGGGGG